VEVYGNDDLTADWYIAQPPDPINIQAKISSLLLVKYIALGRC
jgi:hypothetical protein